MVDIEQVSILKWRERFGRYYTALAKTGRHFVKLMVQF